MGECGVGPDLRTAKTPARRGDAVRAEQMLVRVLVVRLALNIADDASIR
ncbi:MAG: hypothetical protein M0014_07785 [Actinomycetota bacterium]|nr:hypothetical protein [Actinomycetota bacterium]